MYTGRTARSLLRTPVDTIHPTERYYRFVDCDVIVDPPFARSFIQYRFIRQRCGVKAANQLETVTSHYAVPIELEVFAQDNPF
jgi:hypothetical protein